MRLTERTARKLPAAVDVLELDVTDPTQVEAVREELTDRWGRLDGVLHAIGFAPESCLGGCFLDAPWDDVAVALHVSAYSLKALAAGMRPLLATARGTVVGLTFDATVAWPAYDWMGVAKAAFESTARYLARELGPDGITVNLISAGPIRTMAAKSIPGFSRFEDTWNDRSPLGWDVHNQHAVARSTVALMSGWFPMTTGEIVHVDGGYHAVGA
jgi:enoyl-[acyl-carrier protein] reductase I